MKRISHREVFFTPPKLSLRAQNTLTPAQSGGHVDQTLSTVGTSNPLLLGSFSNALAASA